MPRKSLGSGVGQAILRAGWKALRLFLRHPVTTTIVVLSLMALASAYRIWRSGFPAALRSVPSLAIYLILIVVILVCRKKIRELATGGLSTGRASLPRQVAKEVVAEGLSQGEAVLKREAEGAREALSTLAQEVKADWQQLVQDKPTFGAVTPQWGRRCPSCGRILRMRARFCDGCGAPLPTHCPHCGRTLRPKAKFCDGCGTPLHPVI